MSEVSRRAAALARPAHALLRIGAALLFLQHGVQKVFGVPGGTAAPVGTLLGAAGIAELAGGVLLVAGLWTSPVALVLLGEMLSAFLIVHFPRGGWPIQNGGELPLLYALVFAFLAAAGAGPGSLDTLRRRPASRS